MKAFLCLLLTMLLATLAYAQDSVIVKQVTIEPHIGVGFNGNAVPYQRFAVLLNLSLLYQW